MGRGLKLGRWLLSAGAASCAAVVVSSLVIFPAITSSPIAAAGASDLLKFASRIYCGDTYMETAHLGSNPQTVTDVSMCGFDGLWLLFTAMYLFAAGVAIMVLGTVVLVSDSLLNMRRD